MKNKIFAVLAALAFILAGPRAFAADTINGTNAVMTELNNLIGRINAKLQAGKITEADLADNLRDFDDIIVKHKGEDSDALAQVLAAKGELYIKFLKDYAKGAQTLVQIQHDFPGTETAKRADNALPQIQAMIRRVAATSTNVIGGLNDLIGRINVKIKAGKDTEADLADNLKEFDALIVKHKGEDPADLAHVLVMKAELYEKVLEDYEKLFQVAEQIQHDFPGTDAAKSFEAAMPGLREQAEKTKIQNALAVQTVFPPFSEIGLDGKPLSTDEYKGKVVLIDFWATWCPPCRAEMPNVVSAYEKYHGKGFEVIGINLDKADGKSDVLSFTKDNKMPWPEYYDGQYWSNKLVLKYGVMGIPMTYLLDGNGKIIAKKIRGDELEAAVAKALLVN
jgi:thiol-disulfide isomerase/thioredoxin